MTSCIHIRRSRLARPARAGRGATAFRYCSLFTRCITATCITCRCRTIGRALRLSGGFAIIAIYATKLSRRRSRSHRSRRIWRRMFRVAFCRPASMSRILLPAHATRRARVSDSLRVLAFCFTSGAWCRKKTWCFCCARWCRCCAKTRSRRHICCWLAAAPDLPRLRAIAEQMGIAERVTFTDFVAPASTRDLYAAADLFVFASRTETQGVSIAEALSSGLPCVVVGAMGAAEAIQNGENGLIVPPRETDFAPRRSVAFARRKTPRRDGELRPRKRARAFHNAPRRSTRRALFSSSERRRETLKNAP